MKNIRKLLLIIWVPVIMGFLPRAALAIQPHGPPEGVYVRQMVDEHRGVISLKSKEGLGTVVTIKLPLRMAEAEEMIKESGDMP
jgi:hypothetical protein